MPRPLDRRQAPRRSCNRRRVGCCPLRAGHGRPGRGGYDLLLEKAIARTWHQCRELLTLAREQDAIVAVCHVLRHA